MPSYTDNHDFQLFADTEEPWEHRSDFQKLDTRTPIVDTNANRFDYEAKTNALYLAYDTETLYRGNGSSWNEIRELGSGGGGGGGDLTAVEGVENQPRHVGPLHQGEYHDGDGSTGDDPRFGVRFWAEAGLAIDSVVVDSDLSVVSKNQIEIQLTDYAGGANDPTVHETTTVTLSGGPERVDLGFTIPSDGEYVLARDYGPDTSEVIPLKRVLEADWGGYAGHTYSQIDFLGGTHIGESGDFGATGHFYFFWDWRIGDPFDQVTSPWSTDVDEIYMRPTDPEDEFDQVSPRALWVDTS